MKSFFLIGIVILFSMQDVLSQPSLPPVFEITNDSSGQRELPNTYWQILADPGGKLTIGEVSLQPVDRQFQTDSSLTKGVDNSQHVYWFRLRLKNSMVKDADLVFFNEPYSERYDLYILRSGNKWDHLVNGVFIPYTKREGIKDLQAVTVLIKPGEEVTIYKRIHRATIAYSYNQHMMIGFGFTGKVIKSIYVDDNSSYLDIILHSFAFGVLLLACIFNFFFYYVNRERVYLFFALFLLFEGFVYFGGLLWFFFKDYPITEAYVSPVLRFLASFFLIHFVRHLLHVSRYFPGWDDFLFSISFIPGFCTAIALFIEPTLSGKWGGLLWLATTISRALLLSAIFTTFIFFKRESNRLIRMMLIAVLPALCLWTIEFGFLYIYGVVAMRYKYIASLPFTTWVNQMGQVLDIVEAICLSWIAIVFSWILFMRYSQLRKEKEMERNALIAQQKMDLERQVTERTTELKRSLDELRSAQSQLIQAEKMASLGELTAGIAHEIQNPLNFVNNFSEVSNELLQELKNEKSKVITERDEQLEGELMNDISQNLEKINHHGKRADAIVKGMLEHSRVSSGVKELADINVLADEYLRLSYHALRAKDKASITSIKTDFDLSIESVNIIKQDIGRVLLNLYNNAFYAVSEKGKLSVYREDFADTYEPYVMVTTKKSDSPVNGSTGSIEIKVTDNGNGIPQKIIDKIFQPFFTTKPTGEGTGLGLSLSYDIIKAHGGELKINPGKKDGAEFIILLPC